MSKKPIICKLCGGEMEERKWITEISISWGIVCKKDEIFIKADTLLKARNKARKLLK